MSSIFPTAGQLIYSKCLPRWGGDLPHVGLLIDEFALPFVDVEQFCEACERGVSEVYLELLLSRAAPDWEQIIKAAAKGGHLHVFQWLMATRSDGRGPWQTDLESAFHEIATNGHLGVLRWLITRLEIKLPEHVLEQAAANGHLDLVSYLCSKGIGHHSVSVIAAAAENGHLEMVQWLHKHLSKTCSSRQRVERGELQCLRAMNGAASGGHLEILKWLHQNCMEHCSGEVGWNAARNGHLEIVQWFHEHYGDLFDVHVMDEAAEKGHLNVLQWLHEHRSDGYTSRAMEGAALNGHLEVIKWLHVNGLKRWTTTTMENAAGAGHLDVVQWLYENRPEVRTVEAIDKAATNGHLAVVQWLTKHSYTVSSECVLERAGMRGHLEMVCWLDENTVNQSYRRGLAEATKLGHLEVLLVLFTNKYGARWDMGDWEKSWIQWCFSKQLDQLKQSGYSFTLASRNDDTTCALLKTINRFHSKRYRLCVCAMLESALKAGYMVLVQRFFDTKHEQELEKYVDVAGVYEEFVLMRWLVENGARLTISTASSPMNESGIVEITWWLCEKDRVDLVCKALQEQSSDEQPTDLLLWLLANTTFLQKTSRDTIRNAVETASDKVQHLLASNLMDSKTRDWCLSENLRCSWQLITRSMKRKR